MGVDVYAFETLTGQRLVPLPVSTCSWTIATNADDAIRCKIPARSAITRKLDIWGSTILASVGLLVVVDDIPVAAGPVWKRSYTQGKDIDLTAGGLRSYWDRRILLPVAARGQSLVNASGDPVTSFDTNLSGLSYGTIAKRWIELVREWPGGSIPMTFPPDETGTREKNVAAVDLKKLRTLLDNLTGLESGPDIAFRPRWSDDGLGVYWEMQTGTNARPRIGQADPSLVKWTVGAISGGAFDLTVDEDGTGLAEEVFFGGGRSNDVMLIAQARNTQLYDSGFPLLQSVDTSHSDVVNMSTMQSYANRGADLGRYPSSFWKMKVRAHEKGTPILGDYWVGDMATITVDPAEPVLPEGDYVRRIAAIGGDERGDTFDITFAEAIDR